MPAVSVIIPTYNRARYIAEAIHSVLDQSFHDLETVVVDDGSIDSTRDVVAHIRDPRLKYVYHQNQGSSAARNTGIQISQGDYIAFLDSDDIYLPGRFDAQVEMLDRCPQTSLVASGHQLVDQAGNLLGQVRPWLNTPALTVSTLLFICPFLTCSVLVRRSFVELVGGFDLNLPFQEDWDLWLRMAGAGCQMRWVGQIVASYRMHSGNKERKAGPLRRRSILAVLDKFFSGDGLSPEVKALKGRAYACGHLRGACREYATGHVEEAKRDVVRAIEFCPELGNQDSTKMLELLLGWGSDPLVGDPEAYERTVLQNLPEGVGGGGLRRKATALASMRKFFSAYDSHDWAVVRRSFLRAVTQDPSWLLNRGVLSILLESVVGTQLMRPLRKLGRVFFRRRASANAREAGTSI